MNCAESGTASFVATASPVTPAGKNLSDRNLSVGNLPV